MGLCMDWGYFCMSWSLSVVWGCLVNEAFVVMKLGVQWSCHGNQDECLLGVFCFCHSQTKFLWTGVYKAFFSVNQKA